MSLKCQQSRSLLNVEFNESFKIDCQSSFTLLFSSFIHLWHEYILMSYHEPLGLLLSKVTATPKRRIFHSSLYDIYNLIAQIALFLKIILLEFW